MFVCYTLRKFNGKSSIFLPMYFFQKLADWSTANQKSIADLSVAFCNIVCYIRKSYCNYRREEN